MTADFPHGLVYTPAGGALPSIPTTPIKSCLQASLKPPDDEQVSGTVGSIQSLPLITWRPADHTSHMY